MENNRADRLRNLLRINANATATPTEGERGFSKTPSRIFRGNTTSKISTTRPGRTFNASKEQD